MAEGALSGATQRLWGYRPDAHVTEAREELLGVASRHGVECEQRAPSRFRFRLDPEHERPGMSPAPRRTVHEHLRDLRPVWLVGGRIEEKLYRAEESIALEGRKDCAASGGGLPRRVGVERLGVLSREPRQEGDRGAAR